MRLRDDLERGWQAPVRFKPGDAVNSWGARINSCADRLDSVAPKLPPEAVDVLRELFEEIGQQTKDAFAAIDAAARA